jgi:tetrahydrodipicolinate N-succinyltransferase
VGSCAQIGKDVHLSGVVLVVFLEPLQAAPVIVKTGLLLVLNCIVVEGSSREEAVLGQMYA